MLADDVRGFRLSPQQRRAWSLWRGEGTAFGARCAVVLEGGVDAALLAGALRRVVARHEILRTAFRSLPGMRFPVQVPAAETGAGGWLDWRVEEEPAGLGDEAIAGRLDGDDLPPFDLAGGPLLRARLHPEEGSGGRRLLVLDLPPLAADSATLDALVAELAAAYGGDDPGEAPVRYVQFAEWQSTLLEDEDDTEGREHWARPEPVAGGALRLPFELPEGTGRPFAPAAVRRRLAAGAGETTLLACWYAVLGLTARAADVRVSLPWAGREHELFEDAPGAFARWLPVAARPHPRRRLSELESEVRERRDLAFEHGGAYDAGDAESPAAAFEIETRPAARDGADVRFRIAGKRVVSERFRLRLAVTREEDGLLAELWFDASRVPAEDAERMLERWTRAVESAAAQDDPTVAELDLLGGAERHRLLVELNRTAAEYPRDACLHHLFEAQVDRTPDAPAIAFEGEGLTYAELDRAANRLAHRLRRSGIGPDVPVALCMERSTAFLVGLLAVLKAGGAYVPLEPWQPTQRLAFMLEDAAPPVVLAQDGLVDRLGDYAGTVIRVDADAAEIGRESAERPAGTGTVPESLAYVIFTSGSTGRPKGVAVAHRQLVNYTTSAIQRLGFDELPPGSGYASVSTFAADLGHTVVFPSLVTGGRLHVVSLARLSDAREVGEYFRAQGVDCLKVVPSHLEALGDQPDPASVLPRRRLVLGGEASRPRFVEELRRRAPECEIYNHYGPSETTVGVLTHRVGPDGVDPRCATVPLGKPIANARVHVLDADRRPVPVWTAGELYVGGDCVTRGYLGRPGLTADRFVPDPFGQEAGGRLYRTGDLTRRLPDGSIEFLGRVDDQVKYHGFRVELNEIRLALNAVEGVRDSVVTLARDDDGRDVLVAYYVSRHEIEIARLRDELRASVLEETIPNLFVHLRRLPLTLNGKINYSALPGLDEARRMVRREVVAPRTRVEEVMERIWAEVLGHEKVSIHDNFFELGGHSLLATRVISRQREALAVEIPLRSLFDAPTVAGLAEVVEGLLARGAGGDGAGPDLVREESDLGRQLDELEEMSDEDAGRMLDAGADAREREAIAE